MMRFTTGLLGSVALATLLVGSAGAALAQGQPSEPGPETASGLEEIVVTAQRREENAQKVAGTLIPISGEVIASKNVSNVADLTKLVPGFQATQGSGPYTSLSVRGVFSTATNSFGDPAVSTNIDGVNLARATSSRGLFYDLQRVEVLKGPQGTLYGRNSTGGALNIITNQPILGEYSGYARLSVGNYAAFKTEGAINLPLTEQIAARVAFQTSKHDGYLSDGTDDEDRQSARASLKFVPSDDLTLTLKGDYTKEGGKGQGSVAIKRDGSFLAGPRTSVTDSAALAVATYAPLGCPTGTFRPCLPMAKNQFQDNKFWGITGTADWNVLGGTATVIGAYRHDHYNFASTGAGYVSFEDNDANQSSIEARFASDATRPLSVVAGVFYMKTGQKGISAYDGQYAGSNPVFGINLSGYSWAGFGQLTYRVTDTIRLTAGGRYTEENKKINSRLDQIPYFLIGNVPIPDRGAPEAVTINNRNFNAFNYKVGAEWDVLPASMLYANVSSGFKAGGYFVNSSSDPLGNTYNPEKVTAYVVGTKNRFFDNRIQLNVEGFFLDYKDQQVASLGINSVGLIVFPQYNVGGSQIKGLEVDFKAQITDDTRFNFLAQYADAVYKNFKFKNALSNPATSTTCLASNRVPINAVFSTYTIDCSGKQSLQTPKFTFNASLDHTVHLSNGAELTGAVSTFYETKRYTHSSYLPFTVAKGGTRSAAQLTYRQGSWSVSVYGENLENTVTRQTANNAFGYILAPVTTLRPPRTYGVRLNAQFGRPDEAVAPPPPRATAAASSAVGRL